MLDATVFNHRKGICTVCSHWNGVCLKGHALASPVGCPERKFPPVEGAVYLEDRPATVVAPPAPGPCCGGTGNTEPLRELTYVEAARELAASLEAWAAADFPVTTDQEYAERLKHCQGPPACGFYRWYQCRLCKCVILAKAKLRTTTCPAGFWPPLVVKV